MTLKIPRSVSDRTGKLAALNLPGLKWVLIPAGAVVLSYRPFLCGVTWLEMARFWLFFVFWVLLPGAALFRLLWQESGDVLLSLGMWTTLGHALETTVFMVSKLAVMPSLFIYFPLAVLLVLFISGRRSRPVSPGPGIQSWHYLLLFAVGVLSISLTRLYSIPYIPKWIHPDHLFHAGNIAELLHHWPIQDPRVVGRAMNYHFFAYAFPAGASMITGIPVAGVCLSIVPVFTLAMLVLQLFNAGRKITRSSAAALAGSAIFLFHTDLGAPYGKIFGWFTSTLPAGIYNSITTATGFVYLATIVIVLHAWLESSPKGGLRNLILLLFLGFVVSGTKGSVMPVIVLGLVIAFIWRFFADRRVPIRILVALAVLGAAAFPVTMMLSNGDNSFVGTFRFSPGKIITTSAFYGKAEAFLGQNTGTRNLVFFLYPVWLFGYLALTGVGAGLYLAKHRRSLRDIELWILGVFLSSIALAYCFAVPLGYSELFFLYNGQLVLSLLAGAGIITVNKRFSWGALVIAAIVAFFSVSDVASLHSRLMKMHRLDQPYARPYDRLAKEYFNGMIWIRENLPLDAVVIRKQGEHDDIIVSVFGERRAFYEGGAYTSSYQKLLWTGGGDPFPDLADLRRRLFESPDERVVMEITERPYPVYALLDGRRLDPREKSVTLSCVADTPFFLDKGVTLVYQNEVMRIYRLNGGTDIREKRLRSQD